MQHFIPMSRVHEILASVPGHVTFANGVKPKDVPSRFASLTDRQRANVAKVVAKVAHYAEQAAK